MSRLIRAMYAASAAVVASPDLVLAESAVPLQQVVVQGTRPRPARPAPTPAPASAPARTITAPPTTRTGPAPRLTVPATAGARREAHRTPGPAEVVPDSPLKPQPPQPIT